MFSNKPISEWSIVEIILLVALWVIALGILIFIAPIFLPLYS